MNVNLHTFESTREAYDACNFDSGLLDGDVIVIQPERVIGVAIQGWPIAVTRNRGDLHRLNDGCTPGQWAAQFACPERVISGYQAAIDIARILALDRLDLDAVREAWLSLREGIDLIEAEERGSRDDATSRADRAIRHWQDLGTYLGVVRKSQGDPE